MKKALVYCFLWLCIATTGCAELPHEEDAPPPNTSRWPGQFFHANTIGLLEAFTEHEALRELFIQVAEGSIPFAENAKVGGYYYSNEKKDFCGPNSKDLPDDYLHLDEETADAIHKLEKLLPGISVGMIVVKKEYGVYEGMYDDVDEGVSLNFSLIKNVTAKDDGFYEELLTYSTRGLEREHDSFMEIEEGWYFFSDPIQ